MLFQNLFVQIHHTFPTPYNIQGFSIAKLVGRLAIVKFVQIVDGLKFPGTAPFRTWRIGARVHHARQIREKISVLVNVLFSVHAVTRATCNLFSMVYLLLWHNCSIATGWFIRLISTGLVFGDWNFHHVHHFVRCISHCDFRRYFIEFFSSNFVDWRQMGLRLLIESFFIAFSL